MKQLLLAFNLLLLTSLPNNLFCAHRGEPLQAILSSSDKPITLATNKGFNVNLVVKPFTKEEKEVACQFADSSLYLKDQTKSHTCIKIYQATDPGVNTFIGFMFLSDSPCGLATEKHILDFNIIPEFQKQGIGRTTFEYVKESFSPKIDVFKLYPLPNAVPFYEKLGFCKSGRGNLEMQWKRH